MCPESMPTSKRQSKLRTMMFTVVLRAKCGHVSSSDIRSVRLANGALDRLRKWSALRPSATNLRIVP